jgi:pimeloyl-ACP methyl ester carboxylesterase
MIERIADLVNAEAGLVRRGRFLSTTFLVEVGDQGYLIKIIEGRVVSVTPGPFVTPNYSFALRAPRDEWEMFWKKLPAPGHSDIFALFKRGKLRIEGDLHPFMANLLYIKDVLAAPRRGAMAGRSDAFPRTAIGERSDAVLKTAVATSPRLEPSFEPILGRYLNLTLLDRPHRLYIEEAGQGIPLLCLHTAGSDGRQYRGLLNDKRITDNHRVIVFDMPRHGKSSPPEGYQNEEYRLTSRDYVRMILEISDALKLDRPVVMGCSIGGRIALYLAHQNAKRFRAIIGIESAAHVAPYYDVEWLHRPDVHGGEVSAGVVSGLVAPTAPDNHRWETLWHYLQSGPGIFKGDLHFYKVDGDIRGKIDEIDGRAANLYLLTGEYDYSCTTEGTLDIAKRTGAEATIMKGLGHFPMSEDPERFISYLLPVLERIRSS